MYPADDNRDHPLAQRFRAFITDRDVSLRRGEGGAEARRHALHRRARFPLGVGRFAHPARRCSTWRKAIAPSPSCSSRWSCCSRRARRHDEQRFEEGLWERLQSLSDKDEWLGQRADPRVAHDPDDPHFAMSFGGEAFFVVGLHPAREPPGAALRDAGDGVQPPRPVRDAARRGALRQVARRDPRARRGDRGVESIRCLREHGSVSAARQYSGRAVEDGWRCPYSGRGDRDAA